MLKHKFKRHTNNCITKRLVKKGKSVSITERCESLPDQFIANSFSDVPPRSSKHVNESNNLTNGKRQSTEINLTKLSAERKKALEATLEYTGASQSSLSKGSRFSVKYFTKQNRFFGEEVVRQDTITIEEPHEYVNCHPSDSDATDASCSKTLCTNWKVVVGFLLIILGFVLGVVLTLITVVGIGLSSSYATDIQENTNENNSIGYSNLTQFQGKFNVK